jgi:two-component system cell cycle sensor histidine kinase/response regulator CckA
MSNYRDLVDNAPDAILVVSKGRLLFANPAAAALVGLPDPDSLRDHNVLEFTTPETRDDIVQLIERLHHEEHPASLYESQIVRTDGTKRDVEIMSRPTMYEGVRASIVFVRDITQRKQAERDLRASEERYRQVVESMNEALVVFDPEAKISFVNGQFCRIFETRPEDLIGKPADAVYAPETVELVHRGIERRRRGLQDRYEAPLKGINGRVIFAEVSAAPLSRDGRFAGSLALITDITDRRVTQEKLRESERRYSDVANSSPNYLISFDCFDRYIAANKTTCDSLGLPEHQIIGRTFEEVGIPPEVAREWRAHMAAVRATGKSETRETVISFRQRSPRILRRTVSPIYGEDGELIGVSVLSIDITDQKLSEENNHKLLRAIEEMDEVMFTTDATGVITYVNPAFERIYGFTRDEAIGKTPRIIRSEETPAAVYEHFWRELFEGRTVRTEFANRTKQGQLVRIIATVSPIHGDDGRLTGFTAVQRDVTAERKAEEQQRQIEHQMATAAKMQALGTLAGGIAHDFNNILSIVLTHATVAELSKGNAKRTLAAIDTIKRAVNRGAGLSRQILTFARNTEVRFETLDVNRSVREIGSMMREMFPRNIQIELDLDPDVPAIRADADQFHQVLLNLALNARDAMSDGGTLRLTTGVAQGHQAYIAVTDTGHGMTPDVASRIFEPFFTTKEIGKGTGLGLAVVYGIMKAHNARIDVVSEPGRGASFRLYFPAVTATTAEEGPRESQDMENGDESLLLIEDELEIAEALSFGLIECGYRVTTANNAEEAAEKLTTLPYDVIITDLGIPGLSSRELVKLIRSTAPDVPVIPITGYVDFELHNDILAEGTQPILEKPFTIDQLLRRIRQTVSLRTAAAALN